MTHWSHNEFHLGDNLIHLHFLRKLALKYPEEQFRHAVHLCHVPQLAEAIEDVPNVQLIPIEDKPLASVNVWKNAGATVTDGGPHHGTYRAGFWESHRFRNNYAWFYIDWFEHLARGMGLENPIKTYKDLWFDYPRIKNGSERVTKFLRDIHGQKDDRRLDFLVVNSQPCSGQLRCYDHIEYMTSLIWDLARKGYRVVCTQPIAIPKEENGDRQDACPTVICTRDYDLTISEIGTLSLHADHLVMVSTGPSWPTFNIWNEKTVKLRLLLLQSAEKVDYAPNLVQVGTREEAREHLRLRGLL